MDHGWAIGDKSWQKDIAASFRQEGAAEPPCGPERDAIRVQRWQHALTQALVRSGRSLEDLKIARKGANWKIALAAELRQTCGANHAWLAHQLNMGKASSVRMHLCRWLSLRETGPADQPASPCSHF